VVPDGLAGAHITMLFTDIEGNDRHAE